MAPLQYWNLEKTWNSSYKLRKKITTQGSCIEPRSHPPVRMKASYGTTDDRSTERLGC